MSKSSATKAMLDELHLLTAASLAEIIRSGVPVFDREGNETGRIPAPAAYISAAIKFLRDNDITAAPDSARFADVSDALAGIPDFDGDDDAPLYN